MKLLNGAASVVGILLLAACQTGSDVSESWLSATVVDEAAPDAEVREFTVNGFFGIDGGKHGHPRSISMYGRDGDFRFLFSRLGGVPPVGSFVIAEDASQSGTESFSAFINVWNEGDGTGMDFPFASYIGTDGLLVINSSSSKRIEGTFYFTARRDCRIAAACAEGSASPSDGTDTVDVHGSFSLRLNNEPVSNLGGS